MLSKDDSIRKQYINEMIRTRKELKNISSYLKMECKILDAIYVTLSKSDVSLIDDKNDDDLK